MPTLSDLKKQAERLCPYPIDKWRNARFDRRAQSPDSASARCRGHKAIVSVIVHPPEGIPHIVLLEGDETIPLRDETAESAEQLGLW